jgi:hypothetical protein
LLAVRILFLAAGAMVLLSVFVSRLTNSDVVITDSTLVDLERPAWWHYLRWVTLGALGAGLVLGLTTYISTEVAAIPLFWVLPQGLYLSSLVISFARMGDRQVGIIGWIAQIGAVIPWVLLAYFLTVAFNEMAPLRVSGVFMFIQFLVTLLILAYYPHRWTLALQSLAVTIALIYLWLEREEGFSLPLPTWAKFWLLVAACAITWWGCNGDLVLSRPDNRYWFRFMVSFSAGTILGAVFMQVIAPQIWNYIFEFPLVLGLALLLRLAIWFGRRWST